MTAAPVRGRRRGGALVAVMIMLLVMGALGATLLTRSQGTRIKNRSVLRHVQKELALDAGLVHGFHVLKNLKVEPDKELPSDLAPAGSGEVAGVRYEYRFTPEARTKTVRIDVKAGEDPPLEGNAVAYLSHETRDTHVTQCWAIRYFGPEPRESETR